MAYRMWKLDTKMGPPFEASSLLPIYLQIQSRAQNDLNSSRIALYIANRYPDIHKIYPSHLNRRYDRLEQVNCRRPQGRA